MVVCGKVIVRTLDDQFLLSCLNCNNEMHIEKWQEFVLHVENVHRNLLFGLEDVGERIALNVSNDIHSIGTEINDKDEPISDCLIETSFVEVPMSDNTDCESEDDKVFKESPSTSQIMSLRSKENSKTDTCEKPYTTTSKFNPTFYRRSPRITKFIELYKGQPCLWDPNNASYRDKEIRSSAYSLLIDQLKSSINVHLTHYKLKKSIASLHSQYAAITRQKRTKKLSRVPLYYHELYSFLGKRGNVDDSESDEDNCNDKIKLLFTETNQLTTLFISFYAKFPVIYDPDHKDFSNVDARKAAYINMAELLSMEMSLDGIASNDIYDGVMYLRQWYCRKIKGLTEVQSVGLLEAEHLYIEKCRSFLPTKTFRLKIPCTVCQESFSTDHSLQAHSYRVHKLGEWPFKCTICGGSFERRCHLQQHNQRVHIGKVFHCGSCSRSFAFQSQLNIHVRTHEETHIAKPFVCEFCGKSFKQKIQLTNHVTAVHTKIRAFRCHICPKDFLTKRDLTDHIKAHLNIRDKVCEICQKAFTNANALVKHRHIHKEKTLQCTLCSTRFSERVSLGVHMKRTHKIIRNTPKISDILKAS